MLTTTAYCLQLIDAVREAGHDPKLAYVLRTRLRRALTALERGRRGTDDQSHSPVVDAPSDIKDRVHILRSRVLSLCQPSEALSLRWAHGWQEVCEDVDYLREWLSRQVAAESGVTD
jgi:hypothetical protein